MIPKLLIIPDVHCHPEYSNSRLTALGKFILDEKPDTIVCLGDFADMPSLSSYDKGKKSFEGRRYKADIKAAIDGQEKLFSAVKAYNKKMREQKMKQYRPKLYMTLGNHEDRINRAVNDQPELDGVISIDDLKYDKFGWKVVPFQETLIIENTSFCHYHVSGVAGRAISGEHIGASLCNKLHMSSVQGHSHVFNHAERTQPNGVKIFGLSAGCYSSRDQVEGWNFATEKLWWHGVIVLHDFCDGYYDELRAVTQRKILRDYL